MAKKITLPVDLNIDAAKPGQAIQGIYDKAKALQSKTDAYSKRQFAEYSAQLGKLMNMDGEVTIQTTINTTQEKGLDGVYKTVYQEVDKLQSKVLQGLDKENKARAGSVTSLKQQLAAQKQLLNATAAYVTKVSASGKKFRAINPEIAKIQAKINQLGKDLNEAFATTGQGSNIVSRISSLGNKFTQLNFQIQAVAQAIQVIQAAASQFVNRAKDIQRVQLAFEALGVSVANQDQILQSSRAIALTYGASIQKIEKAYLRLGPAIMQSGGSLSDTEQVIESISAKAVTLGLNTEQTGRYIEAFAQVMGKGRLQGEELNQQFAELDGALRGQIASYMESAYGIKDLSKAMQDGEISAQMFKEAFIASAEESRKVVAGSMGDIQKSISTIGEKGGTTIQQVMARINSLITIGMEAMGEALAPLGESLLRISAAFAQFFAKIATGMPGIQTTFKELSAVIGVLIEFIVNGLMVVIYEVAKAFDFWITRIQEIAKAILGDNWVESFTTALKVLNVTLGILAKGLVEIFGVILGGAGVYIASVVAGLLKLIETLGWLINLIPGMEGVTESFAEMGDMRSVIDSQTALGEAVTGTTNAFKKEDEEVKRLEEEMTNLSLAGKDTTEKQKELNAAIDALNTKKAEAEMKRLEGAYDAAKTKLDEMIEAQKAQLERDKQLGERKIEVLNKEMEVIKKNADAKVDAVKKETEEVVKGIDEQIRQIQRKAEAQKRETEDEKTRLNSLRDDYKTYYDGLMSDVEAFYDEKRSRMEESHAAEMDNLDAEIAKVKEKYAAQLDAVSDGSGPQQQKLQQMKLNELRKEARTAETAMERQRAKAEIEKIQNSKRRAQLEKQQAEELKKLAEEKAQKEKEQAEEKKRLDEEEKKRKEEIKAAEMKTMEEIKTALEVLAGIQKQNDRDAKDRVTELKDEKREAKDDEKTFIDEIREAEEEQHEERKKRIEFIKKELGKQEDKVEDIEEAVDDIGRAERGLESDIDYITNGALQRQLEKAKAIGAQLAQNASQGSSGGTNAGAQPAGGSEWRGGPVTGGTTYRVNEIGKEGFVGKDGSMFELPGSANSRFTAPMDGEIIPANIWSEMKAQGRNSKTPKGANVRFGSSSTKTSSVATNNNVVNNVTIQAQNPVQASNNVMVQLTKLKRLRYS